MNILKLKGKMVEKGLNAESLANATGVSRATIYRKLDDSERFTIGEAKIIKEVLELITEEAHEIFLA